MDKQIIDELRFIAEIPQLYLANYFEKLRADVDIYYQQRDSNDYLYKEIISEINRYEKNLNKTKYNLILNLNAINQISNIKEYQLEKENLLGIIFQNKTIIFNQNKTLILCIDYYR